MSAYIRDADPVALDKLDALLGEICNMLYYQDDPTQKVYSAIDSLKRDHNELKKHREHQQQLRDYLGVDR